MWHIIRFRMTLVRASRRVRGLTFGSQYTGRALVVGSGFVHFRAFVVLALGVVLNCTGRRWAIELRWCRWGLAFTTVSP